MGTYVADQVVLLMARKGLPVGGARALVLGLAFKENCPDVRNTRVVDIVQRLIEYGVHVDVTDPWVNASEAKSEYGFDLVSLESAQSGRYQAVILAVAHREFAGIGADLRSLAGDSGVIYDVKGTLGDVADARL